MVRRPHGCAPGCLSYTVTISGTGRVEYNGISPVQGIRTRTIPADEVVQLVNEFLRLRFFQAAERYGGTSFVVRNGDMVELIGRGGSGPRIELTLKLGNREKSVTIERDYPNVDYPDVLRELWLRIDEIGGPEAWKAK